MNRCNSKELEIIIVVGLPGSGKTTYVQNTYNQDNILIIDDFNNNQAKICELKKYHEKLVIIDPLLCLSFINKEKVEEMFQKLVEKDFLANFSWHVFENNLESCLENIKNRDDRVISKGFVIDLSREYNPLKYSQFLLPVYKKQKFQLI